MKLSGKIGRAAKMYPTMTTGYVPMRRGFLYLVAIMDWATRKMLFWRLSNTLDASFCVEAVISTTSSSNVCEDLSSMRRFICMNYRTAVRSNGSSKTRLGFTTLIDRTPHLKNKRSDDA